MKAHERNAFEAGVWCCAYDKTIKIEEILRIIDGNLTRNLKRLYIHADCCGAGGIKYRLAKFLRSEALILNNISNI